MKEMKDIKLNIPLVNFDNTDYPLVMASFHAKSGKKVGGAFIIDTASRHNILNEKILPVLKDKCLDYSGVMKLTSFLGKGVKGREAHFDFKLEENEYQELFYVASGLDFESVFSGHVVLGILGLDFLIEYGLVLDYQNRSLSSSTLVFSDLEKSDIDYLFPLEYGFEKYGLPVVVITNGKKDYVCLVDSGSNFNTTTKFVLENGEFKYYYTGIGSYMTSVAGKKLVDISVVHFKTLGVNSYKNTTCSKNYLEEFQMLNENKHIIDGTNNTLPISFILGSRFMNTNNWVIDFSAGLVFARKKNLNL